MATDYASASLSWLIEISRTLGLTVQASTRTTGRTSGRAWVLPIEPGRDQAMSPIVPRLSPD